MKEIWDKKAKTFPRYNQHNQEDKPIFEYFDSLGIQTKDKNILDLGCGNGRYALHFAKVAKNLYAFDISENMLSNVREDAKRYGISNIKTFCGDWGEFDTKHFTHPIDIIFASLTPALNSFDKFKKAYDLARECIMYIGWGRKRENKFLDEVFSAHNASVELPVGAPNVSSYLEQLGKEIPKTYFITKNIHHKKSLDDAIDAAIWQMEAHKVVPKYDIVKKIAKSWEKDGKVRYTSIMEIGLMAIKK